MNKNLELKKWNDFKYKLHAHTFTFEQLDQAFIDWNKDLRTYTINSLQSGKNLYMLSFLRIITKDKQWLTISYMQKSIVDVLGKKILKIKDPNELLDAYDSFFMKKMDNYDLENMEYIVFSYKLIEERDTIPGAKITHPISKKDKKSILDKVQVFKKFGLNLPLTMDYTLWGEVMYEKDDFAIVKETKGKGEFIIKIFDRYLLVDYKINDKIIFSFKDVLYGKDYTLTSFSRFIKNHEYIIRDGKEIVNKETKNCQFIKPLKKAKFMSDKIITMDIETRTIDGYMWPFCVSIYDGNTPVSFYQSVYENCESMLNASVKYLMHEKYNKHRVFVHNFSYFDAIFLINTLNNLGDKCAPKLRDGRIIDFKFYYNKNYYLNFRDSFLLLPESLAKLAISFSNEKNKIENKGVYPYKFLDNMFNSKVNLNYIGLLPRFKFFESNKLSIINYINYRNKFKNKKLWSLKDETIKYSELDTVILYKILIEFNKIIFSKFRVDAFKYPTISSLAFAIYRTKYLKEGQIPIIDGKLYKDIKLSFTGGVCDVFKPFNSTGEKIYCYDVNSLYPFVMKEMEMPVGNPVYFEGDILKVSELKDLFGFFEVEVTAPLDINIPLLQKKIKTDKDVERTIAPVGNWTGVYFSEELKKALSLGYKFKIYRGYLFEKANIFSEFVTEIYAIKEKSLKGSANYTIAKLLLNSLYGRFGMKPIIENSEIIDPLLAIKLNDNKNIIVTNIIELKNGKELISFFDYDDYENNIISKFKLNISVPISAAITAYSRIYMNNFLSCTEKNMLGCTIFYTDTDSLYINKELDSKYISNTEIGKFKLERIFEKGLFLGPKMYGGTFYENNKYLDFSKIKGLKNSISYRELLPLLFKDKHITITQEKWFRNVSKSTIEKKLETKHTLKLTSFKRQLVYDNNKFVNTKPIILNEK
jgi:DNA polymerase type B, organellar and viral